MKLKYYKMDHRGGLNEALKTKVEIYEEEFKKLFKEFNYEYYCFDKRINCIRFIISEIPKNYNKTTVWLLIEIRTKSKKENQYDQMSIFDFLGK